MNPQLTFDQLFPGNIIKNPEEGRRAAQNNDEYVLRKAKIIKLLGSARTRDDRIRVQVLPELAGISDDEKENCPAYPPFMNGTFTPGDKDDLFWVVCTPDLQNGYVLGPENFFSRTKKESEVVSYNFGSLRGFLGMTGKLPLDFQYEDIVIQVYTGDKNPTNPRGGLIQGYNRKTGAWFVINSAGACFWLRQDEIWMRVGTPTMMPSAYSAITITANKIYVDTPRFEISPQAQQVVLWPSGCKVAAVNKGTGDSGEGGTPFWAVEINDDDKGVFV